MSSIKNLFVVATGVVEQFIMIFHQPFVVATGVVEQFIMIFHQPFVVQIPYQFSKPES